MSNQRYVSRGLSCKRPKFAVPTDGSSSDASDSVDYGSGHSPGHSSNTGLSSSSGHCHESYVQDQDEFEEIEDTSDVCESPETINEVQTKLEKASAYLYHSLVNNLSDAALEQSLKLANLYGASVPSSVRTLKATVARALEDWRHWIHVYLLCLTCSEFQDECQCISKKFGTFYEIDIMKQISLLLTVYHEDVITHWGKMQNGFRDVLTDIVQDMKSPFDIHLIINADGACFYTGKQDSMWPIQCSLLNLSPLLRQSAKSAVLFGLWSGDGKPKREKLLSKVLMQFPMIGEVSLGDDKEKLNFSVKISFCICDLPALSSLANISQFNGYFACVKCLDPGCNTKSRKGGNAMCYGIDPDKCFPPRTAEEFAEYACLAAANGRNSVYGIKGLSVLRHCMTLPDCIILDTMHFLIEGVKKRVVKFTASSSIGRFSLQAINDILVTLPVPHDMEK